MNFNPFVELVVDILHVGIAGLGLWAVLTWLVALGVVNRYHPFVARAMEGLHRITAPALDPIRKRLPDFGGFDLSPIILILLMRFVQHALYSYVYVY